MSDKIVYLNGQFLPHDQACVSVLDRGFLFGDGVYEVIPVFGGKLLRLHEHLQRLQNSMNKASLANPMNEQQWTDVLNTMLDRNPGEDRSVYLQVTRGAAAIRDLSVDESVKPTVFVMVNELPTVDPDMQKQGIEAITVNDFRWEACDIKSVSLIANVMMRLQATAANVADAIMVRGELVTEGTASNVFMVKDDVILTPPKSKLLLPGITRDLVIELAHENGIAVEEREINKHELESADEIWLTSSTREIAPVVKLDQRIVGDGQAGSMWHRMIGIYQRYKQELRNG